MPASMDLGKKEEEEKEIGFSLPKLSGEKCE